MIASNSFSEVLDATRIEEQCRAIRGLLMYPIVYWGSDVANQNASGLVSQRMKDIQRCCVLVRRHQAYLTHWFSRYTGWTLILRSGSARLVKRPWDLQDSTRGAIDPGAAGTKLSRSRYVLWSLALAVLHDEGRQTTLHRLADQSVRLSEEIQALQTAGFAFDLKRAETRRAIVCVVRLLLQHGLLRRVEGDETKYGDSDTVDCLYDIDRGLLTDVLHLPTSGNANLKPVTNLQSSNLDARLATFLPNSPDNLPRPRDLEHRLIGRLLDNPVMYFDELTEREFAYWQSQRGRLVQVVEDATGLIAELRAEGVAMLDLEGELTDAKMPDSGTVAHATLLMAEFLADQQANAQAGEAVLTIQALSSELSRLAKQHEKHWRKNICEAQQTALLLDDVLERLEMLRMLRRVADGIIPQPAIHRFAVEEV